MQLVYLVTLDRKEYLEELECRTSRVYSVVKPSYRFSHLVYERESQNVLKVCTIVRNINSLYINPAAWLNPTRIEKAFVGGGGDLLYNYTHFCFHPVLFFFFFFFFLFHQAGPIVFFASLRNYQTKKSSNLCGEYSLFFSISWVEREGESNSSGQDSKSTGYNVLPYRNEAL